MRGKLWAAAVAAAVLLGAVVTGTPAGAAPTVLVSGLDNPRGVAVGPGGRVYVAEAGRGGDTCEAVEGPDGPTTACFGATSRLSVYVDGTRTTKTIGFPSLAAPDGSFAAGVHDVAVDPLGRTFVAVGAMNSDPTAVAPFDEWGSVRRASRPDGRTLVADLGAFEAANDPDGNGVESNPYGLAALPEGGFLVADAAANALLKVAPDRQISVVAALPVNGLRAPVAALPSGPAGPIRIEPVPTAVAVGPDGNYYVGELTGFPFPPGFARIWKVTPAGEATVYADGFTSIIDLTFGPDGSLYVLQLTKLGVLAGEILGQLEGALYKVSLGPLGIPTKTEIAPGAFTAPGGVAISADGAHAYVTNKAISAGEGELLLIPLT